MGELITVPGPRDAGGSAVFMIRMVEAERRAAEAEARNTDVERRSEEVLGWVTLMQKRVAQLETRAQVAESLAAEVEAGQARAVAEAVAAALRRQTSQIGGRQRLDDQRHAADLATAQRRAASERDRADEAVLRARTAFERARDAEDRARQAESDLEHLRPALLAVQPGEGAPAGHVLPEPGRRRWR